MAMNIQNLDEAVAEAERFIVRAKAAKRIITKDWGKSQFQGGRPLQTWTMMMGGPETGAARRASMDLTRALAKLRKV